MHYKTSQTNFVKGNESSCTNLKQTWPGNNPQINYLLKYKKAPQKKVSFNNVINTSLAGGHGNGKKPCLQQTECDHPILLVVIMDQRGLSGKQKFCMQASIKLNFFSEAECNLVLWLA